MKFGENFALAMTVCAYLTISLVNSDLVHPMDTFFDSRPDTR
jgi:hypothetical protein